MHCYFHWHDNYMAPVVLLILFLTLPYKKDVELKSEDSRTEMIDTGPCIFTSRFTKLFNTKYLWYIKKTLIITHRIESMNYKPCIKHVRCRCWFCVSA